MASDSKIRLLSAINYLTIEPINSLHIITATCRKTKLI